MKQIAIIITIFALGSLAAFYVADYRNKLNRKQSEGSLLQEREKVMDSIAKVEQMKKEITSYIDFLKENDVQVILVDEACAHKLYPYYLHVGLGVRRSEVFDKPIEKVKIYRNMSIGELSTYLFVKVEYVKKYNAYQESLKYNKDLDFIKEHLK